MADSEVPEEWYEQGEDEVADLEIEEIKLESETVHKGLLELLFQKCNELEFGEEDGLTRIDHVGHGQYKIVRSYVDVRETNAESGNQ